MARAARTASVIVVLLGALALGPSVAAAAIEGTTAVSMPSEVTLGQTGVIATITLTNKNTDSDEPLQNVVCDASYPFPCDGSSITLLPACGLLTPMDDCFPTHEDPSVFTASTAIGQPGTECADFDFDVTTDPVTGALKISPDFEQTVALPMRDAACKIDVTLAVVGMPVEDQDNMVDGMQTRQLASSTQKSGTFTSSSRGMSFTTVKPAQPSIATTASGNIVLGAGVLTDAATVSGRVNPTVNGTVTFKLFGPGDTSCATSIFTSPPVSVAGNGSATSPAFTPTLAGTYRWIASYSGDANNAPVAGLCNDPGESVTVAPAPVTPPPPPPPATPTIAILASPGIMIGGKVSAVATLAGRSNPVAGSTVLFRLFGPDDPGCAGTPVFAAAAAVDNAGGAASPLFAPQVQSGTYRWTATYSGDPSNVAVATACNAPGSTVAVASLPPDVLSAGFASQPRAGELSFLTVGAFDPLRPISGLQVQFGEPSALSGVSACRLGGFGVAASPVLLRLPYIFRVPGRHTITIVVLSGDCSGELTRTTTTIEVFVAARSAARTAVAAVREPAARAAQSACKNTLLRPSGARSRAKVATAIRCLVNAERRKRGLKSLKPSKVLAKAATGHSTDMLKRRFFEHAGPGGPSLRSRLQRVRYRGAAAAENIAYGSRFNAKLVVQAWMNSPPHKANILAPGLRFLGVGIVVGVPVTPGRPGSTYTQVFGSTVK